MFRTLLVVSVNIVIQVIIQGFGVSLNSDWITCDYGRQEA